MQQDQDADWHVADLTSKMAAMFGDFFRSLKAREERLAWVMALGAYTLQLAVFPLFVEGIPADTDDRALPGADLLPTWKAAVIFVTRQLYRPSEPASCRQSLPSAVPVNSIDRDGRVI